MCGAILLARQVPELMHSDAITDLFLTRAKQLALHAEAFLMSEVWHESPRLFNREDGGRPGANIGADKAIIDRMQVPTEHRAGDLGNLRG